MESLITGALLLIGLLIAGGLSWLYYKGRAYRRLIRMWRYQSLADERNPRTRAIRTFLRARVVTTGDPGASRTAKIVSIDRGQMRVNVWATREGHDPRFGG